MERKRKGEFYKEKEMRVSSVIKSYFICTVGTFNYLIIINIKRKGYLERDKQMCV